MNFTTLTPDFGGGLSLDELVGMTADEIFTSDLPKGQVFKVARQAADRMLHDRLDFYILMEIWADGHTVWHGKINDDPAVITPTGQLIRTRM